MGTGRGATGPSRNDRRQQARETARRVREEAARKARRRKIVVQGSVILGIVSALAIVGAVVFGNGPAAVAEAVNPKNMPSGGVRYDGSMTVTPAAALTKGAEPKPTTVALDGKTAHIQIWVDYQCPGCKAFEAQNAEQIEKWLTDGTATLELHPVAIRDIPTNNEYSTRSAAAASCVASSRPEKFWDVNAALFADQPDEANDDGLTNDEILKVFADAGVSSKAITTCVTEQTHADFVTNATLAATSHPQLKDPIRGGFTTPAVFVNGERYRGAIGDPEQFAKFVETMVRDAGSGKDLTFPPAR